MLPFSWAVGLPSVASSTKFFWHDTVIGLVLPLLPPKYWPAVLTLPASGVKTEAFLISPLPDALVSGASSDIIRL